MKKIFLYTYAHCNFGDDLFVKTICDRYPDDMFYMECASKFLGPFKDIKNLRLIRKGLWFKFMNKIRTSALKISSLTVKTVQKCDATVILGGSMFIQKKGNNNWKDKLEHLEELRKNSANFFIIGANFGPYSSKEFQKKYCKFFSGMNDVCFRDKNSVNTFNKLPNVRLGSDVVFNLNFPKQSKGKNLTIVPISLKNRNSLFKFEKDYLDKMASLIVEADKKGFSVTLHSFCSDQGDEQAIQEILNRLDSHVIQKISILNYHGDIQASLNSIAKSSLIVSTRFHGMILGWLGQSQVYPIKYDIKMDNLLKDLGLSDCGCKVEDISKIKIDKVFENSVQVPLSKIKELYDDPFSGLDSFLYDADVK